MKLWWQNIQKLKGSKQSHESCESTCHECTSKVYVQNDKEDIVFLEGRINPKDGYGRRCHNI